MNVEVSSGASARKEFLTRLFCGSGGCGVEEPVPCEVEGTPIAARNHSAVAWRSNKFEIAGGQRGPSTPRPVATATGLVAQDDSRKKDFHPYGWATGPCRGQDDTQETTALMNNPG